MGIFDSGDAYKALGVRRLINAAGADTTKGGSILTQQSLDLMADANRSWVDMRSCCVTPATTSRACSASRRSI